MKEKGEKERRNISDVLKSNAFKKENAETHKLRILTRELLREMCI